MPNATYSALWIYLDDFPSKSTYEEIASKKDLLENESFFYRMI